MTDLIQSFFLTLLLSIWIAPAQADILDRIANCEKAGGGPCVFNILRELAGGENFSDEKHCKCETASGYKFQSCSAGSSNNRMYKMIRDGRMVSKSECSYDGSDAAYSACIRARLTEPACK